MIRFGVEVQTQKHPRVRRDAETVTVRWGQLELSMSAQQADELRDALTRPA